MTDESQAILDPQTEGREWAEEIKRAKEARAQAQQQLRDNPRPPEEPAQMKRRSR